MLRRASFAAFLRPVITIAASSHFPAASPSPPAREASLGGATVPAAPPQARSAWRAIPTSTAGGSCSAISATSGRRARTDRPPAPHRSLRARHLSAFFARRQVDRILLEPLRRQRRVRGTCHRRRAETSDVPQRRRRCRRMDERLTAGDLPRDARRRAPFQALRRCIRSRNGRAGEAAAAGLGLLGPLFARRQVAGRSTGVRAAGHASTIAAARPPTCGWPTLRARRTVSFLATSATTACGRCGARTIRSTSSPIRCRMRQRCQAGHARGSPERQQHLQDRGARRRPTHAGDEAHRGQSVLAVDVQRRQGHRLRERLRHLEAGRRRADGRTRSRSTSSPTRRRTKSSSKPSRTRSMRSTSRRPAGALSSRRADNC